MAESANSLAAKSGPGKLYEFQLLKKKGVFWRLDVFPIFFTCTALWYFHGTKVFDREELVPVLSFMVAVTFHSLMFFVNFWNADISILIQYSKMQPHEELASCSHIWV